MNEVAKLLGVRLNMPFYIVGFDPTEGTIYPDHEPYSLTKLGLIGTGEVDPDDLNALLNGLLTGVFTVKQIPDNSVNKFLQLCYVDDNIMYFTTDMENVRGDDWDDSPFQHNADPPYDRFVFKKICFEGSWEVDKASDRGGSYNVYDINRGALPWLYQEDAGALMGGTSYSDCITWLRKAGLQWAEMHD